MGLFDLTGRIAIVTGGNGGIGLGMAKGLAEAGAKVVIAARNRAKSEAAVAGIRQAGGDADWLEADIGKESSAQAMVMGVAERFGGVDILVNNAGLHVHNAAHLMTLDEWDADIDVNLTGMFVCCRTAFPYMAQRGGGKIINVASVGAFLGQPFAANYGATKGGAVGLTKQFAVEWASSNIQVNAVLPGFVDTDMTAGAKQGVPGFDEAVARRAPAKRWGVGDDFKGVAVFLAGAGSDYVTGAEIVVDGGYSIALY